MNLLHTKSIKNQFFGFSIIFLTLFPKICIFAPDKKEHKK